MIDLVQYRSRIGTFSQKNFRKGNFTLSHNSRLARGRNNVVGKALFHVCLSLLQSVLLIMLIIHSSDPNISRKDVLNLNKSEICSVQLYSPSKNLVQWLLCQTSHNPHMWLLCPFQTYCGSMTLAMAKSPGYTK